MISTAFAESQVGALIGSGKLFHLKLAYANWHIPDDARNQCVNTALEEDFDYLFFMDADMIFPKGCLGMMVRHMADIEGDQPPVLGGVYCSRSPDHRWHVYEWVKEDKAWKSMSFPLNDGVLRVDAIGTGCMLIDMNVFEIIKMPFFEYDYQKRDGKWERLSEDMVFSRKCMDEGIPMYADSDVTCGHLHSVQVWPTEDQGFEVKTLSGDVY